MNNQKQEGKWQLQVVREIHATREQVFEMYRHPRHLDEWWGPDGFVTITSSHDFKPGGVWKYVMIGPDKKIYPNRTTFTEIVENEKIVYRHGWDEEDREEDMFTTTIQFEDAGDGTKLTVTMQFVSEEEYNNALEIGAEQGLYDTLNGLEEICTGKSKEFYFTRTLNVKRDDVWEALTKEEHLVNWFGPKGAEMKTTDFDLSVDGRFHYNYDHKEFGETWGLLVFKEISSPNRLVYISSFSDEAGNIVRPGFSDTWPLEVQNSITLYADGERTHFILQSSPVNATSEEIEMFINTFDGMNQGFTGMVETLEEYVKEISTN